MLRVLTGHVAVRGAAVELARQVLAAAFRHLVIVEADPDVLLVLHPRDVVSALSTSNLSEASLGVKLR